MTRSEAEEKAQIIDFQGGYTIELVSKIYDDFEKQFDKAIMEAKDSGWRLTAEDQDTCLDILYELKEVEVKSEA